MINADLYLSLAAKHAGVNQARMEDILFSDGLDMSSIRFTEMIMEIEEEYDLDIDVSQLDASIKTVGQLYEKLNSLSET